jgi:hypothetical protein
VTAKQALECAGNDSVARGELRDRGVVRCSEHAVDHLELGRRLVEREREARAGRDRIEDAA